MDRTVEQLVRHRAAGLCGYCLLPERDSTLKHVVDHIIARQHGGSTSPENLALCCGRCNLHKGPNVAGIDPDTGQITRLFNPRNDRWQEHFEWNRLVLVGLTPPGRVTVAVLAINAPKRVRMRVAMAKLS